MTTLFDVILQAHTKAGTVLQYGVSSGGSTITLNDQTYSSAFADDEFKNGTIFIIDGSSGAAKQFRRIASYDASSGEFTFSSGVSTTITAGVSYAYSGPEFNIQTMIELTNMSLNALGPLVFMDRSLVSSANQQVYQLSTNIKYSDIIRVDIQGRLGSSSDDPEWEEVYGWEVQPSTAGAANLLVLDRQPPAGREFRIWYDGFHPRVTNSTSIIDERIHPELITLMVVEKMYEYRNSKARGSDEFSLQRWNDAKMQAAEARVRWPLWRPRQQPKLFYVGDDTGRGGPLPPPYGPVG